MVALYQLTHQLRELERLADEGEVPEEVLRDTLEGLTGEIQVKAENVAAYIQNVQSTADAIDDAIKQMQTRKQRLANHVASLRTYLHTNMEASGVTKISCPWFQVAIKQNPPRIVIDDETQIPPELMVQPPTPAPYPDKTAIKERIKAGETVGGCHVERGTRLEIKA
jgi:hypothetical protein